MHDLEAHVFCLERDAAVHKAVGALSPRERVVIIARHGLDDAEPRTLDQTALELAKLDGYTVTRERIAQIERKAMRHLKARGGLHEVAGLKPPSKPFDAAAFMAHQQVLKAERAAQERHAKALDVRIAEAQQRAAQARRDADDFAAQQRAKRARRASVAAPQSSVPLPPWRAAVAALGLFAWPEQPHSSPSSHYDWMQRAEDLAQDQAHERSQQLARWRAGGPAVNPFDWMKR